MDREMGGATGRANGNQMRKMEEEVGSEQGEAEGEEGKVAGPSAGSGVQVGGVHL